MAICELHMGSGNALAKSTSAIALLPEGKPGPFPVLYLLHGLWDDHTGWSRRSSLDRYVEPLPLIVIMPNGDRSFYTDSPVSPNCQYETYITEDLISFVDTTFNTVSDRRGRAIAGLSMGGYGAMKLALKHPDLFCAAAAHSSVTDLLHLIKDDWLMPSAECRHIFGDAPGGGPDDLFAVAERADPTTLPALRIDCGLDDVFLESNRRFHSHLTELCIPHDYVERPGGHDWAYWDANIQQSLPWICEQLDIKAVDDEAAGAVE